jgi:hypothetical protein
MKVEHTLETETFALSIRPRIYDEDINCPINTIMDIKVESDEFSASTTMDIDIKDLAKFAFDLRELYENLVGEARIEEPYGVHQNVIFTGTGSGNIAVEGYLYKVNSTGNGQRLEFENDIAQTCLREFCYGLQTYYKKYLQR